MSDEEDDFLDEGGWSEEEEFEVDDDQPQFEEEDEYATMTNLDYTRVQFGNVGLGTGLAGSRVPIIDRIRQDVHNHLGDAVYQLRDPSKVRALEILSELPQHRLTTLHIPTLAFALAYLSQYEAITPSAMKSHMAKAKAVHVPTVDGIRYIRMIDALRKMK